MSFNHITAGRDLPHDLHVIIEIPMHADPIKYEVDKVTGAFFVDRFIGTAMRYPCNYGYIPQTLSEDGDPIDVLVVTPFAIHPGAVIRCRPIGVLKMSDESGNDAKILAVPVNKVLSIYQHWKTPEDVCPLLRKQIQHFFEHYKDLEEEKWVKVLGWFGPEEAHKEILSAAKAYRPN